MTQIIRLGTRGSALAQVQSKWVAGELVKLGYEVQIQIIRTTGDNMAQIPTAMPDVKGLFVKEIEQALLENKIDLAVHSMKDVPPESPDGLMIGAIPAREDSRDALVGRSAPTLAELPSGAAIGSSSPRRKSQLLAARPDIIVADLRGNVDTRLRKLDEGQYDAICIAAAGLNRLGLAGRITEYLDTAVMMPAAGQGALAIQIRSGDQDIASALSAMDDEPTRRAVSAERAVLAELGGGCSVPLGLLAICNGTEICLSAVLCSLDGKEMVREQVCGSASPEDVGRDMAHRLKSQGQHIIASVT